MFIFKKKKNYLIREKFINSVDSNKIWSKTMSLIEIKDLLENLKDIISKHEFDIDKNFIMNSRRKGLKSSILNRLLKDEENTNEQILESLFNLWEFVNDEYFGNYLSIAKELNLTIEELTKMDDEYRKKGIICIQEKEEILEIIQVIINNIKERGI